VNCMILICSPGSGSQVSYEVSYNLWLASGSVSTAISAKGDMAREMVVDTQSRGQKFVSKITGRSVLRRIQR
jgi:hypothetical protein